MKHSEQAKAIINEALNLSYDDETAFIDVVAKEFAISNLGQSLADFRLASKPDRVIISAWASFLSEVDSDEMYEAAMDEYRMWRKHAREMLLMLRTKALPLTVANAVAVWSNTGVAL